MLRVAVLFVGIVVATTPAIADTRQDCFQHKDPDLRLKACTQIIRSDPRAAPAYYNRGLAYEDRGDYDHAIADFNKAIELNPTDAIAYNNRAWAYFKMGKAAQGLPDVEKSLELNPNGARALDTRGHIFEALGRREEAVADFRRALSVGETDPALQNISRAGLERLGVPPPPDAASDGIATGSSRPPNTTQSVESDEFGRSVVRAMKGTMPTASRVGRMTIRLLLDEKGRLHEVRVIKNEGDAQMERMVLDAAKRTRFPIPPKGSTIADRTFVVNYVYR
jgi:TonB family protein